MQVDAHATTPMLLSPSAAASSSSAAVLAAKGERLRSLLFGAEHAERSGDLAGAQVCVLLFFLLFCFFLVLHLQASLAHV